MMSNFTVFVMPLVSFNVFVVSQVSFNSFASLASCAAIGCPKGSEGPVQNRVRDESCKQANALQGFDWCNGIEWDLSQLLLVQRFPHRFSLVACTVRIGSETRFVASVRKGGHSTLRRSGLCANLGLLYESYSTGRGLGLG